MQNDSQIIIIAIVAISLGLFAFFLSVAAFFQSRKIKSDMAIMFSGKEAKDLESLLIEQANEIKALDKEIQELFEISNKINGLAFRGIHKTGIIRFNPFKDIGGDQSFAIALLDGKNNGIVISSLHTREGTRVYAKPILKGESDRYTLTEEEKTAISNAVSQKEVQNKKI